MGLSGFHEETGRRQNTLSSRALKRDSFPTILRCGYCAGALYTHIQLALREMSFLAHLMRRIVSMRSRSHVEEYV